MKKYRVEEVISLLKHEIQHHKNELEIEEIGRVVQVGDGIAWVCGLQKAMSGEMLEFQNGEIGQAFNLESEYIGVIIFGDPMKIREGDSVHLTGKLLSMPVGNALIGRVIDPIGRPVDSEKPINTTEFWPMERIAPGIADRQPVFEPLNTGIKSIDAMIPIGKGQRELIIGDRKTGKTAIAIDTILNQKGKDVLCVYVAIGQKESTVAGLVDILRKHGAMEYTTVVVASSSDTATLQYIAPYSGCAIAEYFMTKHNRHTLVVYDDLSKHAVAYRQISLLLRRPPGREAYPGDIFYLHSRLLERAVKLSQEMGGGSLTALPIIETQEGEVSAYIPTNVISITDGQIYLTPDLFYSGIRPAIDVGISVSRVGGKAQTKAMQSVAKNLRLELAQYRELEAFTQLGSDLDKATISQLTRGKRLIEVLKQKQYEPMPVSDQVAVLYAGIKGYLDNLECEHIAKFEKEYLQYLHSNFPDYFTSVESTQKLTKEIQEQLDQQIARFMDIFVTSLKEQQSL